MSLPMFSVFHDEWGEQILTFNIFLMNHWMQTQQFLTKPQLWVVMRKEREHTGKGRQTYCSKQMVNRPRIWGKITACKERQEKMRDTQRETEITSAAQQASRWEEREELPGPRTHNTYDLFVCLCHCESVFVCTQASMCVSTRSCSCCR